MLKGIERVRCREVVEIGNEMFGEVFVIEIEVECFLWVMEIRVVMSIRVGGSKWI